MAEEEKKHEADSQGGIEISVKFSTLYSTASPQEVVDDIVEIAENFPKDPSSLIPVPNGNRPYIPFSWSYLVPDATARSGRRMIGSSDIRLENREGYLAIRPNMGILSDEMQPYLKRVLGSIDYPMVAENNKMWGVNRYGDFDYANPAFIHTILHDQPPELKQK